MSNGGREARYLIVGGGSAGCVLANRLSAEGAEVVLLEAGGRDVSPLIHIPGGMLPMAQRSLYAWKYFTEPQVHLEGRRLFDRRGKVLGGGSSINGMIYCRGSAHDYDGWAQSGCRGWSYADVLPYFKRAESHALGASDYHGDAGPLNVTRADISHPLTLAWLEAGVQAGFAYNPDINGAQRSGFGPTELTASDGRRSSSARSYLRPARGRPNLRIVTGARVTRVLIDRGRAVGVEYLHRRHRKVVRGEEIILCGGAYASPHLLMLSGIGPADHLRAHGIGVAADLPGVGRNLQDHLAVGVAVASTQPISYYAHLNPLSIGAAAMQYALKREGPLGRPPIEAIAMLASHEGITDPDLKYHFIPAMYVNGGRDVVGQHGYMASVALQRPESRGFVELRSPDPCAPPIIDPNYLASGHDLRATRNGIRLLRDVFSQPAFGPYRGAELLPGADIASDSALDAYIRATAQGDNHSSGTCKMGTDADAVVDPALRVIGIDRLRVSDASVMPAVVSGNTNGPTMMFAEKVSDLLLGKPPLAPFDPRRANSPT